MGRPIIGITCCRSIGGSWSRYCLGRFMEYAFDLYAKAVLAAGGAPVLISCTQDRGSLEAIMNVVDGVLLSGGPDIHPRIYGQEPRAGLKDVDDVSDRLSLETLKEALKKDKPVLGICRGLQVMNAALGGTLIQDLPAEQLEGINHSPPMDFSAASHEIAVAPGTRLYEILGRRRIWVNSQHHQGIQDLAPGLIACAAAKDGLVEAVESPSHRFALGVQWHPEGLVPADVHAKRLFKALVRAAGAK